MFESYNRSRILVAEAVQGSLRIHSLNKMELGIHLVSHLLTFQWPERFVQQIQRRCVVVQFFTVEPLAVLEHHHGVNGGHIRVSIRIIIGNFWVDVMVIILALELITKLIIIPRPLIILYGPFKPICRVHVYPPTVCDSNVVFDLENHVYPWTLRNSSIVSQFPMSCFEYYYFIIHELKCQLLGT